MPSFMNKRYFCGFLGEQTKLDSEYLYLDVMYGSYGGKVLVLSGLRLLVTVRSMLQVLQNKFIKEY
jgi:hypothetical protein